jgi:hypothetical protein
MVGSTTATTNAVANAASAALPPASSTSLPAAVAKGWAAATIPEDDCASFGFIGSGVFSSTSFGEVHEQTSKMMDGKRDNIFIGVGFEPSNYENHLVSMKESIYFFFL